MLVEFVFKMLSAIFVGIYIARYLGPEQFGILSYVLSIVAVFFAFSKLGMDSLLVSLIARDKSMAYVYAGTVLRMILVASFLCFTLILILLYFLDESLEIKLYILFISIGLLFQSTNVIDFIFQGEVRAKYSSIAKSIALALGSIFKLYLVYRGANLEAFVFAYALDFVFIAVSLLITHIIYKKHSIVFSCDYALIKPLLKRAWPLVLASVASVLYMRSDQIMISILLGPSQLGLYAAAMKFYEGIIIIPYVLTISLIPAITKLKETSLQLYSKNLTRLYYLFFWSSIVFAIIVSFLSESLLSLTFGPEYIPASDVLVILVWGIAFSSLGSINSRYLLVEKMENKIASRLIVSLLLNIALNMYLIPLYGINGAAISSIISIFFQNFVLVILDKDLKELKYIILRVIFLRRFQWK